VSLLQIEYELRLGHKIQRDTPVWLSRIQSQPPLFRSGAIDLNTTSFVR